MPSPPGKITFGQQLRSVEAGGFIFTETYHAPGLELPRHDHECANFNLTLRGHYRETMRGRSEECGPSCLVIKPPGEAHSNRYGSAGARCLIVEVTPGRLASLPAGKQLFASPLRSHRGHLVALARRMFSELRSRDSASALVLEGLGLEFLGQLDRRSKRDLSGAPPVWLLEAQERIHERLAEPLGLSGLADSVGVEASRFARAFRMWFGCSVGDYVRRLRLQLAAEQLASSDEPLAELAQTVGFYDQSHLTNAFKRHFGVTPSQYRKSVRPPRNASTGDGVRD